jgi:hypothetical protein
MYSTTFLSIPSGSRRGHTIFGNTSTHNSVNSPRHLDSARTEQHINNNKNASIQLSRLVLERVLLVSRGAVQELCPQVAFIWLTADARQAAQSRSCARRSRSPGSRRTRGSPCASAPAGNGEMSWPARAGVAGCSSDSTYARLAAKGSSEQRGPSRHRWMVELATLPSYEGTCARQGFGYTQGSRGTAR